MMPRMYVQNCWLQVFFVLALSYQIDFIMSSCTPGASNESFALVVDNSMLKKVMISTAVVTTIDEVESEYYGAAISPDGSFCLASVKLRDQTNSLKIIYLWNNSYTYPRFRVPSNPKVYASFSAPAGLAISPDAKYALVVDTTGKIRKVDFQQNTVNPSIAGPVTGNSGSQDGAVATFNHPVDVSISPNGIFALVSDRGNHRIRKIDMRTYIVSTLSGTSQGYRDGSNALFNFPFSIAISPDGIFALIADSGNDAIRKITLDGPPIVSTIAVGSYTNGVNSRFSSPRGVSISSDGSYALVADSDNKRISRIDFASSSVITIVGGESTARFISPERVAISPLGTCSLCRAGTYLVGDTCTDCERGTYSTGLGATDMSACEPCEASKASVSVGGASNSVCKSCFDGEYSTAGASACSKCVAGTFATSGSTTCSTCGAGTFSNTEAASACVSCEKGSYSTLVGATKNSACSSCQTGKYSTAVGATDSDTCKSCELGKYLVASLGYCVSCEAGTFSSSVVLMDSSDCTACSAGTFSTEVGATHVEVCSTCHPGTFSSSSAASICSQCAVGEYSVHGATACSTCIGGYFNPSSAASVCSQCLAGTFSNSRASSCRACEIGLYASADGTSACTSCEAGKYSSFLSATSCNLCAPGEYSVDGVCKTCVAGMYSSLLGASVCTLCEAGTFSTAYGALNQSTCIPCGPGKYSELVGVAMNSCEDCESGKYSSALISTTCHSCSICQGLGSELLKCNSSFNAICQNDALRLSAKYLFAFAPISISGFSTLAFLRIHSVPVRPNLRWLGSIFLGANDVFSNFSLLILLDYDQQPTVFFMVLASMLIYIAICVGIHAFCKESLWLLLTSSTDVKPNFHRALAIANKVSAIVVAGVPSLIVQIWLVTAFSSIQTFWLDWLIWIQSAIFTFCNMFKNGYDLQRLCSFDLEEWAKEQQQEQGGFRAGLGISFTHSGDPEFSRIEEVDNSSKDSCSESKSVREQETRKLSSISQRRNVEISGIGDISIELEPVTEFQDSFDDFEPSILRSNQTPIKSTLMRHFEESLGSHCKSPFEPDFEETTDLIPARIQRTDIPARVHRQDILVVVEESSPSKRKAD